MLAFAAAILVFACSVASVGAAEGKGTIRGSVKNLTAGGSSVASLDVNLISVSGENEVSQQTGKVDEQGNFAFTGLETSPDFTYLVHVQHQGADYGSEPVQFPADKTELTVEVDVFDATSAADAITSPARHYLLEPDPEGVSVTEIVILTNSTDKTYVGSKEVQRGLKETVRFAVPEGAEDLQYGDDQSVPRVVPVEGGFVDTWPIYPGNTQRILSYHIPAKGGTASFSTRVTLAADQVSVLMPDIGPELSVSNLPDRSSATIQEQKFLLLGGQNLAADTELQFRVSRLSPSPVAAIGIAPLAGGVGAVLVAVVAVVLLVRRRRRSGTKVAQPELVRAQAGAGAEGVQMTRRPAGVPGVPEEQLEAPVEETRAEKSEAEILEEEKRDLVAAIARLDDQFEAQEIGAEEYSRLRAERKRRLVEVVERQKALAAEEER